MTLLGKREIPYCQGGDGKGWQKDALFAVILSKAKQVKKYKRRRITLMQVSIVNFQQHSVWFTTLLVEEGK